GKSGLKGAAGMKGQPGPQGNTGTLGLPGLTGGTAGNTSFGTFVAGPTEPPSVTLQASNVTTASAASLTPHTFTLEFRDDIFSPELSVFKATVQVQPSSGPAISATLVDLQLSGDDDGVGDATVITATYQFLPPSADWTKAPDGKYTVRLTGTPVTDLA